MTPRQFSMMRDGALWASAAGLVLAAHLGGALWILQRAEAAAPPGIPDPVFVELAPAPTAAAPPSEEEEVQEIEEAAPEPEPAPDFAMPEPLPELAPLPDMNSLFPPPPDAVALQKPVRPRQRPEREPEPEPKVVQREPEPAPKPEVRQKAPEEQKSQQASTRSRAKAADRTAAPQADEGAASPRQVASWNSRVQSAVARHMGRTRMAGRSQGSVRVTVVFTINGNGTVSGARLAGSTGDPRMDAAIDRQASRLPRMPAPPSGKSISLTLPVLINS